MKRTDSSPDRVPTNPASAQSPVWEKRTGDKDASAISTKTVVVVAVVVVVFVVVERPEVLGNELSCSW